MIPHVRSGIVIWPSSCWHRNWQGVMEDMCDTTVQFELLAFPTGIHDDAIDAVSTICAMVDAKEFELPDTDFTGIISNASENARLLPEYDPHAEAVSYY